MPFAKRPRSGSQEARPQNTMPRWTVDQLADYEARIVANKIRHEQLEARRAGNRPRPIVQEHQNDCARKADNRSKKTGMDAKVHGRFRIRVTVFVSDNRERDLDGALSTILDCLCRTTKRLSEVDTGNPSQLDES